MLRIAVAVALLISAAGIIFNRKLAGDVPSESNARHTLQLATLGFFVGICVSITSIGAGSLTLPLLLVVAPSVALRRLVGTDLAFAVVVLVPSLIGHWKIGDVNPGHRRVAADRLDSGRLRRHALRDAAAGAAGSAERWRACSWSWRWRCCRSCRTKG